MKAHRIIGFAVLLACLAPVDANAQPLAVDAGTRVRVTAAGENGSKTLTGTVLASDATGLVISSHWHNGGVTVPVDHIEKLEIRSGGVSHGEGFLRGAGIGALVGAACGAAMGASVSSGDEWSSGGAAAYGAILLGIVGIPVGGLFGLATSGVQYAEVPVQSPAVAVSLGSAHDQDFVLQASCRF